MMFSFCCAWSPRPTRTSTFAAMRRGRSRASRKSSRRKSEAPRNVVQAARLLAKRGAGGSPALGPKSRRAACTTILTAQVTEQVQRADDADQHATRIHHEQPVDVQRHHLVGHVGD